MRLVPALLSALLPAAAAAQSAGPLPAPAADAVQWSLCQTGQGCHTCRLPISHVQADQALGALGLISGNPGHTVTVMRRKDGEWTWYYDTRRPAVELDRYFGGPGRGVQPQCADVPGEHQPLDGQWRVANRTPVAKNCPAGVAERLTTLQLFRSGPVRFQKPFRASDALPGASVAWLAAGPNRHVGAFTPAGADGPRGRYTLDVRSPEAMAGELLMAFPIPGLPTCEVRMEFDYTRTGGLPATD